MLLSPEIVTAEASEFAMVPIPVVSREKWDEVSEEARAVSLPLVIRGLFAAQAKLWSPERLASQWGDHEVGVVIDLPAHGVPYREKNQNHYKRMALRDFVALLGSGKPCYLNQVPLSDFPELARELDVKKLRLGRIFSFNLWVGSQTRSGLHFDYADNLFGQIHGKKRALMVSPKYSKSLYPFDDNPSKSQVDLEQPDLARHPKCAQVEVWKCELEGGDALYMPKGWWHHICAEDVSISINCWHGEALSELERLQMFFAGGPRVMWRATYDFVWHGLCGRPYMARLFSPPPAGVQAYNRIKSYFK